MKSKLFKYCVITFKVLVFLFIIFTVTKPFHKTKSYEDILSQKLKKTYGSNWNKKDAMEGLWIDWIWIEDYKYLNKNDYQNKTGIFDSDYIAFKQKILSEGLAVAIACFDPKDVEEGYDAIDHAQYQIEYLGAEEEGILAKNTMAEYSENQKKELLKAMWSSKEYKPNNNIDGRELLKEINMKEKIECVIALDKIFSRCDIFSTYLSIEGGIRNMGGYKWKTE